MEKKKNYYLLVSVDDIYNKQTLDNAVVVDNNKAREVFAKNNIPHEFRKLIVKVAVGGITEPVDAFELITDKMFCFRIPFLKSIFNPTANPVIELLAKDIRMIANNHIYHADAVKEFYQEIIDSGLALNYGNAIREILNVSKERNVNDIFTRIKKKK